MDLVRRILRIEKGDGFYTVYTNACSMRMYFVSDDIIRIRVAFSEDFSEESYALALTCWPDRFDTLLGEFRKRISPTIIDGKEQGDYYSFTTNSCELRLYKDPFAIKIYNFSQQQIYSDVPGRAFVRDHRERVYHYSIADLGQDYFYGFGETTGKINKLGKRIRHAPRDAIGYDAAETTPLYKHIPFYIRMNKSTRHALGFFYHNTYDAVFDVGCERSGYWPRYNYYCADGGDVDVFIINGPQIRSVVQRYTDVTGKTAFSPVESLSYIGSTMYYTELPQNCDAAITQFVDKSTKYHFPIGNYHLSSGYTTNKENKRHVFTWNQEKFPAPREFFAAMKKRGVSVSPNVKPGILPQNPHYATFATHKAFVMNSENGQEYIDRWWGGPGAFVDFTNPRAREIWKSLLKKNLLELGADSLWNDNCEYEINDARALGDFDGKKQSMMALKSVEPLLMAQVAYEAIREVYPQRRPFVINRAGYAGFQRYASSWCGDNYTSWKSLRYNMATILGMGLCGVANYGADIGGFAGPRPSAELLVRWIQNGIFQPRFCIHSCNSDNTVTQPWMYSDYTSVIEKAMALRRELRPFLYSLLYHAHITGEPIVRPLVYEFQEDENTYEESFHFMLGESLLVANVMDKGATQKQVYLPRGANWYCWHTHNVFQGGTVITIPVDIASIPLFIRDNGIIPLAKKDKLKVKIGGAQGKFVLFEDDGHSNLYLQQQCLCTEIKVHDAGETRIEFCKTGKFTSVISDVLLEVIQQQNAPYTVTLDKKELRQYINRDDWHTAQQGWYYSVSRKSILIKYRNIHASYTVAINSTPIDLLGM